MDSRTLKGVKATNATVLVFSLLAGLGLSVFGIVALFDSINGLITENQIPTAFIILGSAITLVSVLGLLGVTANNRSVVLSFTILLGVLILAQIAVIMTAFSAKRSVNDLIDNSWTNSWKKTPRVIRDVQETFQCCGLKNVEDRAYPKSSPDACSKSPDFGYKDSCYDAILNAVQHNEAGIITAAVSVAVIQVLTFILSLTLYINMPTSEEREGGLLSEHERLVGEGRQAQYGSAQ